MYAYVKYLLPDNGFEIVAADLIRKFKVPFDKFKKYTVVDGTKKKKAVILAVEGKTKSTVYI